MKTDDPLVLFQEWFQEAGDAGLKLPNAMALATVSASTGRPSNRFVLLKDVDERGFIFYSNYDSRKGQELSSNPWAAGVIHWFTEAARQVRIEGRVERLAPEESEAYFHSRSRGSQIAAMASPQSRVVGHRGVLEARVAELETELDGQTVPLPDYWGGYRIIPDSIEFWTEGINRLHDRVRYRRASDGEPWLVERLAP